MIGTGTVIVTPPVIVAGTVTVSVAVAAPVIVAVAVAAAVRCPDVGDAPVKGGRVETPHHHLRRP